MSFRELIISPTSRFNRPYNMVPELLLEYNYMFSVQLDEMECYEKIKSKLESALPHKQRTMFKQKESLSHLRHLQIAIDRRKKDLQELDQVIFNCHQSQAIESGIKLTA